MTRKQRPTASNEFIIHVNDKSGRVITVAATQKSRRSRRLRQYTIGASITAPDDKFDIGLAQDKALGRSKRKTATVQRIAGINMELALIAHSISGRIAQNIRPFLTV